MHPIPTTLAGLLALVATTTASSYIVDNHCQHNVSLTWSNTNSSGTFWTEPWNLTSGAAFTAVIAGQGNSLGITRLPSDYWDSAGPKMIFGTSTVDNVLYWDLSSQVAEPFTNNGEQFNLTSSGADGTTGVCGTAQNYTTGTHACKDDGVVLGLHLCSANS